MRIAANPRHALCLIAIICILLLWFVSGVTRIGSLFGFSSGLVALLVCLWAARVGRRKPLFVYCLLLLMAGLVVASLELTLQVAPGLLSGTVANHAYGAYHPLPGGIYKRDRLLGHTLRPNQDCRIYWNGHWWRHQTNARGYRGPLVEKASVVLLGDSMIYGHGVEQSETVASQLQAMTGDTVANLGQQGACLIQMVARYRSIGSALRPQVVVVCSHPNDLDEACGWYPEDELQRYLAAPLESSYQPIARRQYWPAPGWRVDRHVWDEHLALSLRVGGALFGLRKARREWMDSPALDDRPMIPPPELLSAPFTPWVPTAPAAQQLGWQAHCRALLELKNCCTQDGAMLVVTDVGVPLAFSAAIEGLARELGLVYSPAGRVARDQALRGEPVYLPRDGHWTPEANAIVAKELRRSLPRK
jgi:hypothetical protein